LSTSINPLKPQRPTQTRAGVSAIPAAETVALPRLADLGVVPRSVILSPLLFSGAVRMGETLLLAMIGFVVASQSVQSADFAGNPQYVAAPALVALAASALFHHAGLYALQALTAPFKCLPRALAYWTAAIVALIGCLFFLKAGSEFSRAWVLLWYVTGCIALFVARIAIAGIATRAIKSGNLVRRAVIYGGGDVSKTLLRDLEADPGSHIRICGIFDDRGDGRVNGSVRGFPCLGNSTDLLQFTRDNKIDLVIMAIPMVADLRMKSLLAKLGVLPTDIRLAGNASQVRLRPRAYSYIGSVAFLDIHDKPIAGWSELAKSAFDKVIATFALVLLSPIMAAVSVAIALDRSCSARSVMGSITS
jgi:FlaA1/EpsC-like NDP-sugar epimerase